MPAQSPLEPMTSDSVGAPARNAASTNSRLLPSRRAALDAPVQSLEPLALCSWIQWQAGKQDDALATFATVRRLAAHADMDLPALQRLAPVAMAAGAPADWREPEPPATDIGTRPDLTTLGPAQWQAWPAGEWTARTAADEPIDASGFRGRPHIVILTLGQACSHCNQQVKAFADKAKAFSDAGLPIVVISTDTPAELGDAGEPLPFPVHSGADGVAFRALDAWDDFENKPLHATCLVAADGRALARAVRIAGKVEPLFVEDIAAMPATLLDTVRDGDVVITMGAGSIGGVAARIKELTDV
jgi:peroxiredoxin